MIKVLAAGKTVATFGNDNAGFEAAVKQARALSLQNRDVSVYIQDGANRSTFRNGYCL